MKRRCGGERKSEQEVLGLVGGERGGVRERKGRKKRERERERERKREGEGGRETGKTAP